MPRGGPTDLLARCGQRSAQPHPDCRQVEKVGSQSFRVLRTQPLSLVFQKAAALAPQVAAAGFQEMGLFARQGAAIDAESEALDDLVQLADGLQPSAAVELVVEAGAELGPTGRLGGQHPAALQRLQRPGNLSLLQLLPARAEIRGRLLQAFLVPSAEVQP